MPLIFSDNGKYITKPTLVTPTGDILGKTIVANTPIALSADTDVTIPAGTALRCEQGGIITIPTGRTLTIIGSFSAGLYQCFDGAGSVIFNSGAVECVRPEWFGAKPDNDTDSATTNTAAFNKAMNSFGTQFENGILRLSKGDYITNGPLVATSKAYLKIEGVGYSSVIKNIGTAEAMTMTGCIRIAMSNFALNGNGGVNGAGASGTYGLVLDGCADINFDNFNAWNHGSHGIFIKNGGWQYYFSGCKINQNAGDGINSVNDTATNPLYQNGNNVSLVNTQCSGNASDGIRWAAAALNIAGCDMEGNLGAGIHIDAKSMNVTATGSAGGFSITGSYIEQNKGGGIKLSTDDSGGKSRVIRGGEINGNFFNSNFNTGTGVADALITSDTGTYVRSIQGVHIGKNAYIKAGTAILYNVHLTASSEDVVVETGTVFASFKPITKEPYYLVEGDGVVKIYGAKSIVLSSLAYQNFFSTVGYNGDAGVITSGKTANIYALASRNTIYALPLKEGDVLYSVSAYVETDATNQYTVNMLIGHIDASGNNVFTDDSNTATTAEVGGGNLLASHIPATPIVILENCSYYCRIAISAPTGGTNMQLRDPIINVFVS